MQIPDMVKQLHYEYTLGMTLIIRIMRILSLSFPLGQWWMYFLSFFFYQGYMYSKAKTFQDQTNNG